MGPGAKCTTHANTPTKEPQFDAGEKVPLNMPAPSIEFFVALLAFTTVNVVVATRQHALLRGNRGDRIGFLEKSNDALKVVPHPVNGPGKILGHFMVAPNKIYKEEKPGQEGYNFMVGWGHQGSSDPGCKDEAAGYIKNCQNKPPPQGEDCEQQLQAWQSKCLMGKYIE